VVDLWAVDVVTTATDDETVEATVEREFDHVGGLTDGLTAGRVDVFRDATGASYCRL
jgi:hypothetical protein